MTSECVFTAVTIMFSQVVPSEKQVFYSMEVCVI